MPLRELRFSAAVVEGNMRATRRPIMATVTELSKAALDLLRHRLATRDNRVTTANMEAYRELVRAGIMFAVSGFVTGPEASFRFTDAGWQWVNDPANPYALQEESPVPGR
jgi:hypothetical protein